MAYDGVFINHQINEIKPVILGEHISRITENSDKDIDLHIRKHGRDLILTLSANPNFPHILLTESDVENKMVPPSFCMLLRKYLDGGIIKDISQVGTYERIVYIKIENIDDTGDKSVYRLYIEIMGKYSNIILTKNNQIIDVLIKTGDRLKPKSEYSIKDIANKKEILAENNDGFNKTINNEIALAKLNNEVVDIPSIISKCYAGLSKNLIKDIASDNLNTIQSFIKNIKVTPCINYKDNKPSDFYLYKMSNFYEEKYFDKINMCLETYIKEKYTNINDSNEKKNLQNIVKNLKNKLEKKLGVYEDDIEKSKDAEKYKIYGDMVSAFGYNNDMIHDNILTCTDYNTGKSLNITLDKDMSIAENVKKFYDRYNKLKRTKENAEKLLAETKDKLIHIESISSSIDFTDDKNDLFLIKEEISEYFDESKKMLSDKAPTKKKAKINMNIHHYKSSNGIDIYVGKNNLQNEYLTFTMADSDDTWLHVKDAPGSHVIIKKNYESLDDKDLVEAASLAAYFSTRKNETKTTVDYTLRKELKKVKGKAPGFCIYHKNYSINVKPELTLKEI